MIWLLFLLAAAVVMSMVLTFRPLGVLWLLREQALPCHLCQMIVYCVPVFEMALGLIPLSMGVGLVLDPVLMPASGSPAMAALLAVMPQWLWTVALLSTGLLQMVAMIFGPLQFAALGGGLLFWSFMTFSTSGLEHTLAPWIYGPLAFKSFVALLLLSWETGRVD